MCVADCAVVVDVCVEHGELEQGQRRRLQDKRHVSAPARTNVVSMSWHHMFRDRAISRSMCGDTQVEVRRRDGASLGKGGEKEATGRDENEQYDDRGTDKAQSDTGRGMEGRKRGLRGVGNRGLGEKGKGRGNRGSTYESLTPRSAATPLSWLRSSIRLSSSSSSLYPKCGICSALFLRDKSHRPRSCSCPCLCAGFVSVRACAGVRACGI